MQLLFVKRMQRVDENQKELIDGCIESHYNMIRFHRKQILELCRKKSFEEKKCMECFDFNIIKTGKNEDR